MGRLIYSSLPWSLCMPYVFVRKENVMTFVHRASLIAGIGLALGVFSSPSVHAQLTILKNFRATVQGAGNDSMPPDTMGAVGNNHYVELINGGLSVFDKSTGNRVQRMTDTDFWNNANVPTDGFPISDPRVLFDGDTQRWYASAINIPYTLDTTNGTAPVSSNQFLLAVSNTSDPTQGWHGVTVDADSGGNLFGDFPTLGINGNNVYVGANMYQNIDLLDTTSGTQTGVSMVAVSKSALVNDTVDAASVTRFENLNPTRYGNTWQAVQDLNGGKDNEIVLSNDPGIDDAGNSAPSNRLFVNRISGEGTPAAVFQNVATPTVNTYSGPPPAQQKGTSDAIETNDARFSSVVYRVGNSIWSTHSITVDGRAGIRWYQIDAKTNKLLQQGEISKADMDYYFPSLAVNSDGAVVIGFTGSGDNQYASSYAVLGRTVNGVTTFSAAQLLKAGNGAFTSADGSPSRWGDYSSTTLDPTDSSVFWLNQEVTASTDHWATQITAVRIAAVPELSIHIGLTLGMGGVFYAVRLRRRR